jgi:hypothetical protein
VRPTAEFFREFGKYIYGYKNPVSDTWDYIGKGIGDRAYSHVSDKDLDWDDCFLIARNLEKYDNGSDGAQFSMEAFLIQFFQPKMNTVSGRYQEEVYIMSRFSGLFEQHLSAQREMYVELHDFIRDNEVVAKNVGFSGSRGKTFEVETGAIDNVYCKIKLDISGSTDQVSVVFKGSKSKVGVIESIAERCSEFEVNGTGSGNDPWVSFSIDDLDTAVQLWSDFVGA